MGWGRRQAGHMRELLPWRGVVHEGGPTVVLNKGGRYMATLGYQGADVAMLEPEAQTVYVHQLNQALMGLGTGTCLHADLWHEPTTAYPQARWTNPTACFVDASRQALWDSGVLCESQAFATLTWSPPSALKGGLLRRYWMTKTGKARRSQQAQDLESFCHATRHWGDRLAGVFPRYHWLDTEETLTYLQRTVTWERARVKRPALVRNLAHTLATCDLSPGHTLGLGPGPESLRYVRIVEVQQWPEGLPESGGGLGMDVPLICQTALAHIPYRMTVRYLALDKQEGEAELLKRERHWDGLRRSGWPSWLQWAFPAEAEEAKDSLSRALVHLRGNEWHYGYVTPTVMVWGDTQEEVDYREREVLKAMRGGGLVLAEEHVNSVQAWHGMVAGDVDHNAREILMPSLGTAFVWPHAQIWAGDERDEHLGAGPLSLLSSDNVPFREVMHPGGSEVGSAMIAGPARSGKSGKVGFSMSQFQRYLAAQLFCFDKDWQHYVSTMLHGGVHYDFEKVGLQPLKDLDQGPAELRWAEQWVTGVIESQRGPLTPQHRTEVALALRRLAGSPVAHRTLTGFRAFVHRDLKEALNPFLAGQSYGFLDAHEDQVRLTDWTTFEMRTLLAMPPALPHALRCLFWRIGKRFTGRPTLVVLEEVRKLLQDPTFAPEVLDYLKERGKANVATMLTTQELYDLTVSSADQAIRGSVASWHFLPNGEAMTPAVRKFYEDCGLSDKVIQLIALSQPHQDYIYKAGPHIRRYQLRLSGVERALVAASSKEEIAAMQMLQTQELKEPLTAAWLRLQGYEAEANIFVRDYTKGGRHDYV